MKVRRICLVLSLVFFAYLFTYGTYLMVGASPTEIAKVYDVGDPVNILLMGGDKVNKNTDTIMVVRYDPKNAKIFVMSIPRDTRVYYDGYYTKINAVFPTGEMREEKHSGINDAKEVVSNLLDIKIDYGFFVDIDSFKEVIDILGGIEDFYVPVRMRYKDSGQGLDIDLYPGKQFIDGNKAEMIMRFRSSYDGTVNKYYDGSDLQRIKAQQRLLKELVKQKAKIATITKINELVKEIFPKIETDMSKKTLLKLCQNVSLFDMEKGVRFRTVPCSAQYVDGVSYVIIDEEAADRMCNHFLRSRKERKKLPSPTPSPTPIPVM